MLKYILCIILSTLFVAYGLFNSFIFHPPRPPGYPDTKSIIKIKTADSATISALYLPDEKSKYVILVSHGNAEDLGYIFPFLTALNQHGYAVFAYDYDGYGTSTGSPSEKNTYADVDAAYHYLITDLGFSPDHIIAYGHSLGAAVALDLASRKPVAGLILAAPFVSAFRVVTVLPILPFDKFNNLKKIDYIHCPVLIIHGKKDQVIPFWHGQKLYEKALQPKYFLWIDKAGHNNILETAGPRYWETLTEFIHTLNHPRTMQ